MRVLLSDVDQQSAERLRGEIRAWDATWSVEAASSFESVLARLHENHYEVVVWELATPGAAGLLAVRQLRAAAVDSALLITAFPAAEVLAAQSLGEGADAYIIRHPDWTEKLLPLMGQASVITRRHRETTALARELEHLRAQHDALLDSLPQALLVLTPDGRIEACNQGAADLVGRSRQQLQGENLGDMLLAPGALSMLLASMGDPLGVLPSPGPGLVSVWRDEHQTGAQVLVRHQAGHFHLCSLRLQALFPEPDSNLLASLRVESGEAGLAALAGTAVAEGLWQAPGLFVLLADRSGRLLRVGAALATASPDTGSLEGLPLSELVDATSLAQIQGELGQGRTFQGQATFSFSAESAQPVQLTAVPLGREAEDCSLWLAVPLVEASGALGPLALEQILPALTEALRVLDGLTEVREATSFVVASAEALLHADVTVCHLGLAPEGEELGAQETSRGLAASNTSLLVERLLHLLREGHLPRRTLLLSDLDQFCRRAGDNALRNALAAEGLVSGVWLPVTAERQPVGFVLAAMRSPQAYPVWLPRMGDLWGATTGRVVTSAALHSQTQRTATFAHQLLRIATNLHAQTESGEVLRKAAEVALSVAHGLCCWVALLDERGQQFERSFRHDPDSHAAPSLDLEAQELAWQAVRSQEHCTREARDASGETYLLAAWPLQVEGQAQGVLTMCFAPGQRPSPTAETALHALANHAALALRHAQRLEQGAEEARRMEGLAVQSRAEEARARTVLETAASITEGRDLQETLAHIARNAATEIGFDRVSLYLADTKQGVLRGRVEAASDGGVTDLESEALELGPGDLRSEVALSSAPYVLHSVPAEGLPSGGYEQLLLPLRVHTDLLGLLVADNPRTGRAINPQQTRLLRALAVMAAVAIERARIDEGRHVLISALAHELRRPLASAQAYVELLMEGDAGPLSEQQRAYLQRVAEASGRLALMIHDLMDWSKLRAGHVALQARACDLRELVEQIAAQMQGKARQAQVELGLVGEPESRWLETDPALLEQVLSNLVDNAIKFNRVGGAVSLAVRPEGESVVLEVRDTGPGIPAEFHERIFEEFERGPRELHGRAEGTGLGLATARRLVEYLGGSLELHSTVGVGSTFSVRLPAAPGGAPPATGRSPQNQDWGG